MKMSFSAEPEQLNEVAIVGMACRFPGADRASTFWRNLEQGIESITFFSDQELKAAGVEPAALRAANYVKAKPVLEDIELFDASFFKISPGEATIMDPQQRLFLECAWEALEHAGYNPEAYPGPIGVYAGAGMNSYLLNNLLTNRDLILSLGGIQLVAASDKDYLSTRVSYKLNLRGPSLTVQTASSTSLVAVHLAFQSLLIGECDMALAGGVTINVPHRVGYFYEPGDLFSPDGHCRAFDARAQGTVFGSGAGVVVLKRLSDALRDGDHIHAVIKGSAINNDGSSKVAYTAPSVSGQAAVVIEALSVAGVQPETIGYVEAHGTGTELGDSIEVAALTQAFRRGTDKSGFCALGSVKTNVGHLMAAAGVASLIKTVLALEHKRIPPSLNFERPNPRVDFASTPFYINTKLREWPTHGAPRRAGVSSFGIGGTNAHVILEEAPSILPSGRSRRYQVLCLSAQTETALERMSDNLAAYLEEQPATALADVAYTLHVGRRRFDTCRVVVCKTAQEAIAALRERRSTHDPRECQDDDAVLLTTLGRNWLAGVEIDWAAFYKAERRLRVALPGYPFERERYWLEPEQAR
jgi:acyl transferase domain-containing protein